MKTAKIFFKSLFTRNIGFKLIALIFALYIFVVTVS